MDEIYEPWKPERGQRVRINIGECPLFDGPGLNGRRITINGALAHRPEEQGKTGVVAHGFAGRRRFGYSGDSLTMTLHDDADAGHRYCVRFDEPLSDRAQVGDFAAAELEPLDP